MGEVGGDAAATFTLPAATGSGAEFQFIVSVVNTSNYVIKVADATDTIDGSVVLHQDSANTVVSFNTASDSDTITLNGTTTGGVSIGDEITLIDIATNQYMVKGILTASGTEATPFSASVS
jgi:ribosome-interacting GTPase 1